MNEKLTVQINISSKIKKIGGEVNGTNNSGNTMDDTEHSRRINSTVRS
jgi:hypothetical protein